MNKLCKYLFTSHPRNLYIDFIRCLGPFSPLQIFYQCSIWSLHTYQYLQGCSPAVPDLYEDNTHTHTQSVLICISSATVQETELSMLTVDAACGWKGREEGGEIGGERERQEVTRHCDVAALRTGAARADLSLTIQMECERGIQMAAGPHCHHQRQEHMW